MTLDVGTLIEFLKTLPPNTTCVWANEYDQQALTAEQVRVGGGNVFFFPKKKPYMHVPFWDISKPISEVKVE